jgi:hypothetical protein
MLYVSKPVKKFPTFYDIHNCLQIFLILSQIATIRNTKFHFVYIHLSIIFSPKLGSARLSLSLMFPH